MAKSTEDLKKELNPVLAGLHQKAVTKTSRGEKFDASGVKQSLVRAQVAVNSGNESKARDEIRKIKGLLK